jgi:hypothetical protein
MNTSITKSRLKELVKEVMVEEADYQTFFKKALEKAGKGINDMSDDEKKSFFNKVDTAWNGKGEKNEELTGGQHKLDVDKDGDIEGDDLADLRAGKKADESVNEAPEPLKLKGIKINKKNPITFVLEVSFLIGDEVVISYLTTGTQQDAQKLKSKVEKAFNSGKIFSPSGIGYYAYNESVKEDIATELPKATIPSAVRQRLGMAIDKIKDAKLSNVQKLQLVAQVVDSLGIDKSQLGTMAAKIRSKMESVTEADGLWANIRAKQARGGKPAHGNSDAHKDAVAAGKEINKEESVKEGVSSADMDKIKGAVEAAKSFMNVGAELKKLGMKYTFATEPLAIYIIQPTPNNKVAIVNKKYVSKPDFVVGDIAVGVMESKSIKEESPCWKGYKQVGMKDKGGKQVPNCVPA